MIGQKMMTFNLRMESISCLKKMKILNKQIELCELVHIKQMDVKKGDSKIIS